MGYHAHPGRLPGKGIKLLGEDKATFDNGIQQLLAKLGHHRFVAVPFQRNDSTLEGQPLALTAPVVFTGIAEGRVADGYAGQGHGRPEFLRVQQMFLHEGICHVLGHRSPVHAAQGIVAQHINDLALIVPVKEGMTLLVPQPVFQLFCHLVCLFLPRLLLSVPLQAADFRQGCTAGIREGSNVHGRHRHHIRIHRGRVRCAVHRCLAEAESIVLPGIIHAEGFQAAVMIRVPGLPQVGIELFQAVCQLIQIRRILAGQVPHVQCVKRKAEALKLVKLGLNTSVRVALDGTCQPSVLPLGTHKQQLIVQGCGHVALGIHFAAHGLGLQPNLFIAAALHQHGIAAELLQVQ